MSFQERDNDPKSKQWSFAVKAMYSFTCVMCGRKRGPDVEVQSHHIKRWADHPHLRYVISNGVCLCTKCHDLVTGSEERYEEQFRKTVAKKMRDRKNDHRQKARDAYAKRKARLSAAGEEGGVPLPRRKRFRKNPRGMF